MEQSTKEGGPASAAQAVGRLWSISLYFIVTHMCTSIAHYVDRFGFQFDFAGRRMRNPLVILIAAAVCATMPALAHAQGALDITRTTTGWAYSIASRPEAMRGVLVLMPGFGGNFGDFATAQSPRPALADSLAKQDVALVFIAPPAGVLFGGPSHVRQLEDTIVEALRTFGDRAFPIAVGGFSAGGTDAILLAERCGAGARVGIAACSMPHIVKAVFEVDAPLDWFRIWENSVFVMTNAPPRSNVTEAQLVRTAVEGRIGRRPTRSSPTYLAASPLASRARDGGNARALVGVAVRAYTEPDVDWWIENRNGDYYGMNSLDAAALVRQLRQLGSTTAELITTSGKGYRADGTRHPHSWSIVDQPDLAQWIVRHLLQ